MALMIGACSRGGDETLTPPTITPGTSTPGTSAPGQVVIGSGPSTTQPPVVLTEGQPVSVQRGAVPVVPGEPLDDDTIGDVLTRLPDWDLPADDQTDFATPAERLAPPIAGDTIDTPFPPAPTDTPDPTEPTDAPLRVVRFQPEGAVDVAPFLTVTFDQPMVPLTTLDQLDADPELVPVELTPAVEGRWRWIGARTVRFEVIPDGNGGLDRLPGATEYTATVPAGTAHHVSEESLAVRWWPVDALPDLGAEMLDLIAHARRRVLV